MGLFNNKGNLDKVQLQNIVLGINEKKLQVSDEFLMNMTKVYVSKRMKLVNDTVSGYEQLGRVSAYFKKAAYTDRLLDELITIEPYYIFNYPRPSEYKQNLKDNEENFINQILNRSWKYLRYDSSSPRVNPEVNAYFSDAKSVWEHLPDSSKQMIDELHSEVYGRTATEDLYPEPEPAPAEEETVGDITGTEIGPEDVMDVLPDNDEEMDQDIDQQ